MGTNLLKERIKPFLLLFMELSIPYKMVDFFRDFHRVFYQFETNNANHLKLLWVYVYTDRCIIKLSPLFILLSLLFLKILLHFCFSLHSRHMPFVNPSLHMLPPLLISYHHLLTDFTFMLSISTTFFVIYYSFSKSSIQTRNSDGCN